VSVLVRADFSVGGKQAEATRAFSRNPGRVTR
jgi:hypothetical protein